MSSILLIQADAEARSRTSQVIGSDAGLAVSGAVGSLATARAVIARRLPDLIVADLRLPDGPIVALFAELRPHRSHTLVLTPTLRDPHLLHTLRHGADAYLVADRPPETLLALIRRVLAGESPMAPEIARPLLAHFGALQTRPNAAGTPGPTALTENEQRVLQAVSEGHPTSEIARGLATTPRQVGLLLRSVYRRLHLTEPARQRAPRGA